MHILDLLFFVFPLWCIYTLTFAQLREFCWDGLVALELLYLF
jgi:hypothetical protein